MSNLEATAKRIATPLMQGRVSQLNAHEVGELATWVTKTAFTHDGLNGSTERIVSVNARRWLAREKVPPPGTYAWAFPLTRESNWAYWAHQEKLALPRRGRQIKVSTHLRANAAVMTLGFGQVAFVVFYTVMEISSLRFPVRDMMELTNGHVIRLWPEPIDVTWDPRRVLQDAEVQSISKGDVLFSQVEIAR